MCSVLHVVQALSAYDCTLAICMPQAVQAFVRQAMDYVEKTPNQTTKVELIKTLQSVTEGKVSCL